MKHGHKARQSQQADSSAPSFHSRRSQMTAASHRVSVRQSGQVFQKQTPSAHLSVQAAQACRQLSHKQDSVLS